MAALVLESEQEETGHASGTFHVTLKPLHFVERLRVTDVGDAEPFDLFLRLRGDSATADGKVIAVGIQVAA